MEQIKYNDLNKYGISINCNIMDNKEKRFRLTSNDGSSYIRTESSIDSGWQNSHYHTTIKELCLVQKGEIIYVKYFNNKLIINKYLEGEFFISEPMVPHNVYMFPNTITHTIKFGDCSNNDWIEYKKLDKLISDININDYKDNK